MAAGAGDATKLMKKADALFHLDSLQEAASNHLTSAMSSFSREQVWRKRYAFPIAPECHGGFS
jgi:hypothetical protein